MRLIKDYPAAIEELNLKEVSKENIYNSYSRVKRSLNRLIQKVAEDNKYAKMQLKQYYKILKSEEQVKTRSTNLIILPYMVGKKVAVYNGKIYVPVKIKLEMVGRFIGEFILTRTKGAHSSKGLSGDKIKR